MNNIGRLTNKEYEQLLFDMYMEELKVAKQTNIFPLYLYSKRVYRAYHNAWRIIDRKLLTIEEIDVMLQLGIYKQSQKELDIRNLKSEDRKEMCKIRIGVSY
jgi:hypothetical protein